MKKEGTMVGKSLRYLFLVTVIATGLMTIIATGGGGGGGGNEEPIITPRSGSWSGDDISFTVSENSNWVNDFSVSYNGHATGSYCSFSYNITSSTGSSLPIENNSFSYNGSDYTIIGTFIDTENAEIEVSWSKYDDYCNAKMDGQRKYNAHYQSGGLTDVPNIVVTDSVAPNNDLQVPFGNVEPGTSSEKTVTVTNDGDADLTIGTIAQANSLAAPFSILNDNCSEETLTAGEDCSFTVSFSPNTTATFNDSFDIPSNDPDEDPVTVSVSGTADETATFNSATVTVILTGVASGTVIGSLDQTIDYDETKVTFNSVVAGNLPSGATIVPNDNGDTVRVGLIHANGFDGGANGSILILTFTVIQPNIPSSEDFTVAEFLATDLWGIDLGLNMNNVSINIVNQ